VKQIERVTTMHITIERDRERDRNLHGKIALAECPKKDEFQIPRRPNNIGKLERGGASKKCVSIS
jgi:hypothetical protein